MKTMSRRRRTTTKAVTAITRRRRSSKKTRTRRRRRRRRSTRRSTLGEIVDYEGESGGRELSTSTLVRVFYRRCLFAQVLFGSNENPRPRRQRRGSRGGVCQ